MKAIRVILVALEMLLAVNAVGGGIYGLTGAKEVPREWLQGSAFESYFVPSLSGRLELSSAPPPSP